MTGDSPRFDVHPIVFWVSTGLVLAILAPSLLFTEKVAVFLAWLQSNIAESFGWFYIFSMTGFLIFVFYLMVSRMGSIRLGPDDSEPEFNRFTWFAMLFSAGMGIGLLYFGVAEPIMHYSSPPSGRGEDLDAVRAAMGLTFFHWGLHSWAVYSVVGLSLAYFGFRKGLPFSVRSALYPLIGERIHGWIGNVVDVLAILATLFGIATSLGLGSMQVNAPLLAWVTDGPSLTSCPSAKRALSRSAPAKVTLISLRCVSTSDANRTSASTSIFFTLLGLGPSAGTNSSAPMPRAPV